MKKAQMNISHFRFILYNLKIFSEIPVVTTLKISVATSLIFLLIPVPVPQ